MKTFSLKRFISYALNFPILILFSVCLFSCDDDDEAEPQGPTLTIASISPLTGRVGDEVTITGTGFNATGSQNTVLFAGNVNAPVFEATTTQLKVRIPEGAQNGPLTLTVGEESVTSEQGFTLDTSLAAPTLTSLEPTHGTVGTQVTITGDNFSNVKENIRVMFGEAQVTEIVSVENTSIVVIVPSEAIEGELEVSVFREDTEAATSLSFTVDPLPREVRNTFWSNNSDFTINMGTIDNETKTQVVLYDAEDGVASPNGVAVDVAGGYIYWCNQGSSAIVRAPIDGSGPIETLFSMNDDHAQNDDLRAPKDLALDVENQMIYFTDRRANTRSYIYRGSFDGGAVEQLYEVTDGGTNGPFGIKIKVANDAVYWTEPNTLRVKRGELDGSTDPVILFDGADGLVRPYNIGIDDVNQKIYVIDGNNAATVTNSIYTGSLDGSSALQAIVTPGDNIGSALDIEIDVAAGYIYWLNGLENGNIMRAGLDGTNPEVLFDGIRNGYFFDLFIE